MPAYRLVSQIILIRVLEALKNARSIAAGVITEADVSVNENENSGNNSRHNGDDKARDVSWVVLCSEAKRPDEVACPTRLVTYSRETERRIYQDSSQCTGH
jgi:hypothetical protein